MIGARSATSTRAYGWPVRAAAIAFAILLVGTVAWGLWSATASQEPSAAPQTIAGYELLGVTTGTEALDEINGLHSTEITVNDAWIGYYEAGGAVWAASAASAEDADRLLEEMAAGIERGQSPFKGLARREVQGVPVYGVTDGQQTHYFYRVDDRVIWIAAPTGAGPEFLSAALQEEM